MARKKCRTCGRRRALSTFDEHHRSKDGYRLDCRECVERSDAGELALGQPTPPPDEEVNALLAQADTLVQSTLMPVVTATVRAMRKAGVGRITIDLDRNFVEIPTPERFPLPEEG